MCKVVLRRKCENFAPPRKIVAILVTFLYNDARVSIDRNGLGWVQVPFLGYLGSGKMPQAKQGKRDDESTS
jgi:hypothetical protein